MAARALLVGAAAALAFVLTDWGAKTSLLFTVLLLLGTVYTGLRVWAGTARTGDFEESV